MYVRAPTALIPAKYKILDEPKLPVFMVCGKEKLMTPLLLSPYPAFNLDFRFLIWKFWSPYCIFNNISNMLIQTGGLMVMLRTFLSSSFKSLQKKRTAQQTRSISAVKTNESCIRQKLLFVLRSI